MESAGRNRNGHYKKGLGTSTRIKQKREQDPSVIMVSYDHT